MDWTKWHERYDSSPELVARLQLVQTHIAACLEACPPGPIRVISICAGDGRDLIGVLTTHPRTSDVSARLVELDSRLVERGREAVNAAGLAGQLEFRQADATLSSAYVGAAPAHLVLVCGVFGNVGETAVADLVGNLPRLCQSDGFVIWTRRRTFPDGVAQVNQIRQLFHSFAFIEIRCEVTPEGTFTVGTGRYAITPLIRGEKSRKRDNF